MKNLFSLDNPFIQFLARVADMIVTNALFIVCSLPVVTFGAASVALNKVCQDIAFEEDRSFFKTFFRAFRENFKQATAAWLLMLVFYVGMGCNLLLVSSYLTGALAQVLKWALYFIMALMLCLGAYVFPLIARYENTLREHLINASILAIVKLPRTLLMAALNILPLLIAWVSVPTFLGTMVFWLTLGFSFTGFINSTLLAPVFRQIETTGTSNIQVVDEE